MLRVDRLVEQQALALALLGRQPDPGPDRRRSTEPRRSCVPSTRDRAGGGAPGAVDGLEDLGATRAHQARQPDDLAGVHGEVDAGEDAGQRRGPRTSSTGVARPRRRRRRGRAGGRRTRSSGRSSA